MLKSRGVCRPARALTLPATLLVTLLLPVGMAGQGLARNALASFPDDTQQVAYTNLAQVHSLPAYPQMRQRLLTKQFRDFLDFLYSTGTDPDKDVEEVMLGWRGAPTDTANFFGLAAGRFDPGVARQFFAQKKLPTRQYGGVDFYTFGSGEEAGDLFFGFLDSSLAAFGRLSDVAALVDAHAGARRALDSNSNMVAWEAELEDSAPQWGILNGKAAANLVAPWFTGGAKLPIDPSAALAPVHAVLYRVDWGTGFSARVSVLCDSPASASALAQLLGLWSSSPRGTGAGPAPALSSLDVSADGSRVELTASGPLEALGQVLQIH